MMYLAKVEVRLKPGHSDPEGETVAEALKDLEYSVETVMVSKVYRVLLDAASKEEATKRADEMCRRLLANPTKDDYSFTIEEVR
ncbi:MAG: phosphoribosylformylglycinamidine synthase subunit PurS [Candidatus Bathyarchaeia archaeon]